MVGVDMAIRGDFEKVTPHRHHPQVLRGEFDLRVERVKGPATLGAGCWLILCRHVNSSFKTLYQTKTRTTFAIRQPPRLRLPRRGSSHRSHEVGQLSPSHALVPSTA